MSGQGIGKKNAGRSLVSDVGNGDGIGQDITGADDVPVVGLGDDQLGIGSHGSGDGIGDASSQLTSQDHSIVERVYAGGERARHDHHELYRVTIFRRQVLDRKGARSAGGDSVRAGPARCARTRVKGRESGHGIGDHRVYAAGAAVVAVGDRIRDGLARDHDRALIDLVYNEIHGRDLHLVGIEKGRLCAADLSLVGDHHAALTQWLFYLRPIAQSEG